jgi:hypothetical protein
MVRVRLCPRRYPFGAQRASVALPASVRSRSLDHARGPPRSRDSPRESRLRHDLPSPQCVEERLATEEQPTTAPGVGADLSSQDAAPRGAGALETERAGHVLREHDEGEFGTLVRAGRRLGLRGRAHVPCYDRPGRHDRGFPSGLRAVTPGRPPGRVAAREISEPCDLRPLVYFKILVRKPDYFSYQEGGGRASERSERGLSLSLFWFWSRWVCNDFCSSPRQTPITRSTFQ